MLRVSDRSASLALHHKGWRTERLPSNAAGRLTQSTDPLGNSTLLSYDVLDDKTQTTDALGEVTKFTYDGDRNLTSVTDANGNKTSYGYDAMDRRVSRTDPLGTAENYAYDGNGNLTQVTDRRGKMTVYSYDGLNRQTFVGYGRNGSSYESTVTNTYDAGDRLVQAVDSISGTIARTYDLLDDMTDEQTSQGEVTYSYDAAGRRAAMTVVGQSGVSYAFDGANRLTGITQGTNSVSFTYDNANRRTTVTLPNGIVASMNLPTAVTSNTFNADNEMTAFNGQAITYDANGNLINDGANTYSWDARNHLVGISGGSAASFMYDPFGRRAQKTIGGLSTQFLYDNSNPVQELQGGTPSANLLTGLGVDEYFTRADSSPDELSQRHAGEHQIYLCQVAASSKRYRSLPATCSPTWGSVGSTRAAT